VTIRDFNPYCKEDNQATSYCHPDFQNKCHGVEKGLIKSSLDEDGKPVASITGRSRTVKDPQSFSQWFRDVKDVNINIPVNITLIRNGNQLSYKNLSFFPIDGMGWGNVPGHDHNYHFTMEFHSLFTYLGGETFDFAGDDDIWIFINKKLVVDIGGCHTTSTSLVRLDSLGLKKGKTYQFDLFFAERYFPSSVIKFTTNIQLQQPRTDANDDYDGDGIPDILDNNCPIFAPSDFLNYDEKDIVGGDESSYLGLLSSYFALSYFSKYIKNNIYSTLSDSKSIWEELLHLLLFPWKIIRPYLSFFNLFILALFCKTQQYFISSYMRVNWRKILVIPSFLKAFFLFVVICKLLL